MLCLFIAAPALPAATPLAIVHAAVTQTDGGLPDNADSYHVPGETIFFTARVSNFAKTPEDQIHVAYTVQAFDPAGIPLGEADKNEITAEIGQRDKDWMPKISTELAIPPLALSGEYKVTVAVEDVIGKTSAHLDVPFHVRGHALQPSATLTVENFQFFRGENDTHPVERAAYRPGDTVWAKFDITGFGYGPNNKIDVSYVTSLETGAGKALWTQPDPAGDQTESFYPKRYITADFGINLDKNILPGTYAIAFTVKDAVGSQTYQTRATFTVE